MKYNVTDIEFDFDDGNDGESYPLTFEEEISIRDSALGVWEADNEGTETTIFDCLENCIEIMEAN